MTEKKTRRTVGSITSYPSFERPVDSSVLLKERDATTLLGSNGTTSVHAHILGDVTLKQHSSYNSQYLCIYR